MGSNGRLGKLLDKHIYDAIKHTCRHEELSKVVLTFIFVNEIVKV